MSPAMRCKRGTFGRACGSCCAQSRHDLVDKKINGLHAFSQAQVAEGKLPHHVIALRLAQLLGKKVSTRRRRAGNPLPARSNEIECRRAGVRLGQSMAPCQVGKACMPNKIGAVRKRARLRIIRSDHNEPAKTELWKSWIVRVHL